MKIAVATNDKKKIAKDFEKAKLCIIFDIKDKKIVKKQEKKTKNPCKDVKGCDAVICLNLKKKLYEKLFAKKITPVDTKEADIEKSVNLFCKSNYK